MPTLKRRPSQASAGVLSRWLWHGGAGSGGWSLVVSAVFPIPHFIYYLISNTVIPFCSFLCFLLSVNLPLSQPMGLFALFSWFSFPSHWVCWEGWMRGNWWGAVWGLADIWVWTMTVSEWISVLIQSVCLHGFSLRVVPVLSLEVWKIWGLSSSLIWTCMWKAMV